MGVTQAHCGEEQGREQSGRAGAWGARGTRAQSFQNKAGNSAKGMA